MTVRDHRPLVAPFDPSSPFSRDCEMANVTNAIHIKRMAKPTGKTSKCVHSARIQTVRLPSLLDRRRNSQIGSFLTMALANVCNKYSAINQHPSNRTCIKIIIR
jgi:hypothetical protein